MRSHNDAFNENLLMKFANVMREKFEFVDRRLASTQTYVSRLTKTILSLQNVLNKLNNRTMAINDVLVHMQSNLFHTMLELVNHIHVMYRFMERQKSFLQSLQGLFLH